MFELRTYKAAEGKLGKLDARFRDHTIKLFERHGIQNVGYWHPSDEPDSADTLIYIIKHDSPDAAKESWKAFLQDPRLEEGRCCIGCWSACRSRIGLHETDRLFGDQVISAFR